MGGSVPSHHAARLVDEFPVEDIMDPCPDGPLQLPALCALLLVLLEYVPNLVQQEVEELVRVLVHVAAEQLVVLLQPLDEALGRNDPCLLLLPVDLQLRGAGRGSSSSSKRQTAQVLESSHERRACFRGVVWLPT